MTKYVLTYRMPGRPAPAPPDVRNAWSAWFHSMGDRLVDRGNPAFTARAVGATGGDTVLSGYSVVDADDLDAAVALACGCPVLAGGGGVEVGELTATDSEYATWLAEHATS